MIHTWKGYEDKAWGADELKPRSGRPQNNWGGMGMTLLDSLDVLWIMGMKEEFKRARDWVRGCGGHPRVSRPCPPPRSVAVVGHLSPPGGRAHRLRTT